MGEKSNKAYLGDSVYVEYDGYGVVLTTDNGYPGDPLNMIILEPQVYVALVRYVANLDSKVEK